MNNTELASYHTECLQFAADGAKAGTASEIVNIMVDGVVRACDEVPMLAWAASTQLGRALLSLAIPYLLGVLTVVYPQAIPGGQAQALRDVCLYAIQGHATFAMRPIMNFVHGRLRAMIRQAVAAGVEGGVVKDTTPNG